MLRGRHLPLPVTCQSCLNSCRSWRRSRSPIHLFVPHSMATPVAAATAAGSYTLVKGERESLEMDFRCLFDFLQIPLLRKHKVGEGPRIKGLDFVHPSRKKKSSRFRSTKCHVVAPPHPKFHNLFYDFLEKMNFHIMRIGRRYTEGEIKVCTWLREISSCSCFTALPGPAWVLLTKANKPLFPPLYLCMWLDTL